jgi:hypothetical protein
MNMMMEITDALKVYDCASQGNVNELRRLLDSREIARLGDVVNWKNPANVSKCHVIHFLLYFKLIYYIGRSIFSD